MTSFHNVKNIYNIYQIHYSDPNGIQKLSEF